ncbi:cupin domain-containing protein [Rhodococcus opacus]|jgi:mannose-6-phosphate isomerase-like protein (cupin superfamily)|uniref:cupin domain-containing protein n=1 Tax=Rhodococcus opacus TaxID=37919 RepID=UPI00295541C4|nr:cupin domain-containing protein [Rhodococcus opacus]MDV7087373.1 cupin domain-containing protein [Rhodococcus opacus]
MSFRRVIAAEQNGTAVLVADEKIERIDTAGLDPIWRCDSVPEVPNSGDVARTVGFPDPGGVWVIGWVLEPGRIGDNDNGIVAMDEHAPGFHRTNSVDVHVLLEGSLVLELDDGVEVELNAGDTVVVNGNKHRWHNRGEQTARAIVTICGASRNDRQEI